MINPGTGELITKVACAGAEDINEAVQAASDIAQTWEDIPPFVKSALLNKFVDKIESHMDELATLECEDNGKTYQDACGDVGFSALLVRYFAGLAM